MAEVETPGTSLLRQTRRQQARRVLNLHLKTLPQRMAFTQQINGLTASSRFA